MAELDGAYTQKAADWFRDVIYELSDGDRRIVKWVKRGYIWYGYANQDVFIAKVSDDDMDRIALALEQKEWEMTPEQIAARVLDHDHTEETLSWEPNPISSYSGYDNDIVYPDAQWGPNDSDSE